MRPFEMLYSMVFNTHTAPPWHLGLRSVDGGVAAISLGPERALSRQVMHTALPQSKNRVITEEHRMVHLKRLKQAPGV